MTTTVRCNKDVYFDSALHLWLKKFARQEHWRVASWYSEADLVQDGYVYYCKCRDAYTLATPDAGFQDLNTDAPSKAQRKHFMVLVQRSLTNHLMTLSVKYAINREAPVDCSVVEDSAQLLEGLAPPQPEETSLLMALAAAPAEIGSAIGLLIQDGEEVFRRTKLRKTLDITRHPTGGVTASLRVTRGRRALRETTREHFQRLLGDGAIQDKTAAYLYS